MGVGGDEWSSPSQPGVVGDVVLGIAAGRLTLGEEGPDDVVVGNCIGCKWDPLACTQALQ